MPDENDDILDISLDDNHEHTSAGDDVLDMDLEMDAPPEPGSSPLAPAPKPMPLSPSPADKDDVADLPMVSAGVCARCGYALRPLEDQCPRCARSGPAAPAPSDPGEHAPDEGHVEHDFPPTRSNRGCLIWGIIGSCLLLATAVGIPLAIWMQPGQQAKRQYQLGLQAQIRANFEEARHYYLKALELDPEMGLAAFSMGTTYLGIGNPALMDAIQALTERASNGQTRTLDQRIRTPAHLRAFAHASLALTALIRASAAMQADALEDAMAWFQVVQREAQAALVDDPTNASAEQILRTVEPLIPPASGVN
jgi:hypothetical protein